MSKKNGNNEVKEQKTEEITANNVGTATITQEPPSAPTEGEAAASEAAAPSGGKKISAAQQALIDQANQVVKGLIAKKVPMYGGLSEKDMDKPLRENQLYWVDESMIELDEEANGRLLYAEESMEHTLLVDGVLHTSLLGEPINAKGDPLNHVTFRDLLEGRAKINAFQGYRRTKGVRLIKANPMHKEFYADNFEGRIPVLIVMNLTEAQRETYRKDQVAQRGLEGPEVLLQVIQLIKQGFSERECIERLFDLFYRSAADTKKYDQALIDYKNGKINHVALWKVKHSLCHGRWQTAEAFAMIPFGIFTHYAMGNMARYAEKRVKEFGDKEWPFPEFSAARITTEQVRELGSMAKEAFKQKLPRKDVDAKVIERFSVMMKGYLDRKSGGSGDGSGAPASNDVVGRAWSKKEVEEQVKYYESEVVATALKCTAGDQDSRKRLPEMDAIHKRFENAWEARPDMMKMILADPVAFYDLCIARGIEFTVKA